ncbi:MAG: RNA polymerase sporulation sigma factor SigK [Eubacteriales bacterium]|nr:RNA polymerase sporulation sigma factor SigK [Eubacteriales bacterium]
MFDLLYIIKELLVFAGYISSGKTFPKPLSKEEEAECIKKCASGDQTAKNKLVEHNLRLVAHIVKKYQNSTLSSDDLISIGTIGLIKAVNSFLPKKGTQLATYAAKCIENEVLMALRSSKKIKCEVSLSDPIGVDKEGNEISLIDILGTREDLVSEQAELRIQTSKLYGLLGKCLTRRERAVIEMRYGLNGMRPQTQREIAKKTGISRSYVSRIESKAIKKLAEELSKNTGLKT